MLAMERVPAVCLESLWITMSRNSGRERSVGLPSLNASREARRRSIRAGTARVGGMRPVVWLWIGVVAAVFCITYWRISAGQLQSEKSAVMAKQRAVRTSLGPKLLPFVERVEAWTMDLATADKAVFQSPVIASGLSWEGLARQSGVYLRLLQTKATQAEGIRRAASISLNDGFTSCFFIREGAPDPTVGSKCTTSVDCKAGELCNEWDVCSAVPRPYNMRLAYRAFRILSEDFTRNVQDATDDLQVRALDRELDQITRVDVPVAIEVLQRAKTVTVVVDELPGGFVEQVAFKPGEPVLSTEQRVQALAHDARVAIWDAQTGKQLVRWRGTAAGRLLSVGRKVALDAEIESARARQSNSCMLASSLRSQIESVQPHQ